MTRKLNPEAPPDLEEWDYVEPGLSANAEWFWTIGILAAFTITILLGMAAWVLSLVVGWP